MARTLPSTRKVVDEAPRNLLSESLNRLTLTPDQQRLWQETTTALMWLCPGFTRIMYTMCNPDGTGGVAFWTDDEKVPVAATDGVYLIFKPDVYFGKYTLHERVFIGAHEIMHMILNHCNMMYRFAQMGKITYPSGKSLPYIPMLYNIATDYVINAILSEAKVGTPPKDALLDTRIATAQDNPLDVYAKLYKDAQQKAKQKVGQQGQGNGSGQGQQGQGQGKPGQGPDGGNPLGSGTQGFDVILPPGKAAGKSPQEVAAQRDEGEWKAAVAAAEAVAKAQGKLPAALERFFKSILTPVVDWREALPVAVARSVGSDGYSWRHLDRRLILQDVAAPGRSRYNTDNLVLAIDTSGSIQQPEINLFFNNMRGIIDDCRPRNIWVVWCDAKVHKVDIVEDSSDIDSLKPKGGGGTDFRPVFDWVREQGMVPDVLVYFTDLMGSFPASAPGYPVVWASTVKGATYPWGNVVDLPLKD